MPADITTKQYYKVLKVSDFLAQVPSPESRHPSPVSGGRCPFRSLRSLKRAESLWR